MHKVGQFTPEMMSEPAVMGVIEETYGALAEAIDSSLRHETPDNVRHALQENAFIFSGFKTYHSLREVGLSLTDEKGDIKPFEAFLGDVKRINTLYNHNYLYAEYNHAVASALMADKWKQYEADGDKYYLQYRTAKDDRVRETHRALHGTTLPASDEFWDSFLPPNGWNCRCSTVQVRKEDYQPSDHDLAMKRGNNVTEGAKNAIFRFNPGKTLRLFPPKHPYFPKNCGDCKRNLNLSYDRGKLMLTKESKGDMCATCDIVHQCWARVTENAQETFTECKTSNGKLRVSSLHGKTEKRENVRVGRYLAEKHGYEIDLIANSQNETTADSFNKTLGIEQEYKVNSTPTKGSIDNLLRKGAKQAQDLVLFVDSDISLVDLSNAMHNRVKRTNIKTVMVVINGKDKTYSYDEITTNAFKIRRADLK